MQNAENAENTGAASHVSSHAMSEYAAELERRFDELQVWALANWPDAGHPLPPSEIASILNSARRRILSAGPMDSATNQEVPEPADGGPQYISTTPAPWP